MDSGSVSLIVALGALLVLSAFFSASETAYSALNRIRMKSMAADGNKKAARALALAENYDRLLSSVLIGNNVVNIVTSSLATVLFVGYFGNLGVTLATITTTVLVLLFGEISPKTLAKEAPEQFAMFAAPILQGLVAVLRPVNWLLAQWKKLILKLFKVKGDAGITEQELLTYVEEVRADGGINEQEEGMIRSVIEFDDLEAADIYTPRVDVEAVSAESSVQEIAGIFHETGYSRLPVYEGSIDNIVGVILEKEFHYAVETHGKPLQSILRPALFIPKTVSISNLLGEMQRKKLHMAVVVDERGGTLGIVTIEDIVEELVGEIWDEHDEILEELEQKPDGSYLVRGGVPLEKMLELYGLEDESAASSTAGGWAIEMLGHIPQAGESFSFQGLLVTIEEVKRHRVDLLRVVRQ